MEEYSNGEGDFSFLFFLGDFDREKGKMLKFLVNEWGERTGRFLFVWCNGEKKTIFFHWWMRKNENAFFFSSFRRIGRKKKRVVFLGDLFVGKWREKKSFVYFFLVKWKK